MWKARNDCVFNEGGKGVDDLVEEIQVLSWKWLLGRTDFSACTLYEWQWYPEECLRR